VLSTKRLVAAAKFLVEATKNSFAVPNFVAVRKPFFSVKVILQKLTKTADYFPHECRNRSTL